MFGEWVGDKIDLDSAKAMVYLLIMQLRQILVRVTPETRKQLKHLAADKDASIQIVVREIIEKYFQNGA